MVDFAVNEHNTSLRQACRIFGLSTSVYRYKPNKKEEDLRLHGILSELAEKRPTWGFWMMYHRIRLDGHRYNHKRVYRVYSEAKLNKRRRARKRLVSRTKQPLLQPLIPNLHWSMDFMRDSLFQGKPFRTFNVIDDFNREALNITIAKSITASRVIQELNNLIEWRGQPEKIRVDNGPEFIADELEQWCKSFSPAIELVFIQKGKPNQNGYIERFNKTFREDILDFLLFESIEQAQKYANEWQWMYNNERPHRSLDNLPPARFLLKYGKLHLHDEEREFSTFQQELRQQPRFKRKISIFE